MRKLMLEIAGHPWHLDIFKQLVTSDIFLLHTVFYHKPRLLEAIQIRHIIAYTKCEQIC